MADRLRAQVLDYLERHRVMTLATSGPQGPWAAAVFYVHDGLQLFFLSKPTSRHAQNLAAHPRVAVTVQDDPEDWLQIRGIQLEGTAREVEPADVARVRRLYGDKFPIVGKIAQAPAAIVAALASVRWYRVSPDAVLFIDNALGLGHRSRLDPR